MYGTRSRGISQFYLHTLHSSANGMNHTCLCLPSRSWYSFTDHSPVQGVCPDPHARLQVSTCIGYDLCHPAHTQTGYILLVNKKLHYRKEHSTSVVHS